MKKFENNDNDFIWSKVGDRYVLENMLKNSYNLGGEQSRSCWIIINWWWYLTVFNVDKNNIWLPEERYLELQDY